MTIWCNGVFARDLRPVVRFTVLTVLHDGEVDDITVSASREFCGKLEVFPLRVREDLGAI